MTATVNQHIESLMDDLPQIRGKAKNHVEKSQVNQKDRHDRNLKKIFHFKIGDKVLYYHAAKDKQWSGKLEPKWKGPYYIHQILLNGSYKIREMNGKVLQTPVNGDLLKQYHDRQNWEPQIVI
jgi:hypothetical protein